MSELAQLDEHDRRAIEAHTRATFWNAIRAGTPRLEAAQAATDAGAKFAAEIARSQPVSITCPVCGLTSWNRMDVEAGYCGRCHDWTGA